VTLTLRREAWGLGYARIVSVTLGMIDLQVALGLLVWITKEGWNLPVFRAYIHPAGMLLAIAIAHVAAGRAKKQAGYGGVRIAAAGLLTALAIIVLTIPRNAWF